MRCVETLLICREIHGGLSGVVLEASEVDGVDTMHGSVEASGGRDEASGGRDDAVRKITVGDLRGPWSLKCPIQDCDPFVTAGRQYATSGHPLEMRRLKR